MYVLGAVCFGVDPASTMLRRAMSSYSVSVTRPFVRGRDPQRHLLRRDGTDWCVDALDVLVHAGQQVSLGQTLIRRYAPAALAGSSRRARSPSPQEAAPSKAVFDIYRSNNAKARYCTDSGVSRCGNMVLELGEAEVSGTSSRSLVELRVSVGGDVLRLCAVDSVSGRSARTTVDFASQ